MRLVEMINRYIYAVTQKLPQALREDIADELRSLIEDMLEEQVQHGEVMDKDVEEVLMELGNPKQLAQRYRETKTYLIGPEIFETYILVLKVVLTTIAVSLGAVFVIQIILSPISTLDHFVSFIVSFVTAIPSAFGWITFGFAMGEYFNSANPNKLQMNKEWKVSDLAPIPHKKRQIKRGETIIGMIIHVLFIVIFIFSSEYFGVWVFHEKFTGVVPFLNQEKMGVYLPFIILLFVFGMIKECLKLIYGKWTKKIVIFTLIVNMISVVVFLFLITSSEFWNPNFMLELSQTGIVNEGGAGYETISTIWGSFTLWSLIFLIIGLIWDGVNGVIKIWENKSNRI